MSEDGIDHDCDCRCDSGYNKILSPSLPPPPSPPPLPARSLARPRVSIRSSMRIHLDELMDLFRGSREIRASECGSRLYRPRTRSRSRSRSRSRYGSRSQPLSGNGSGGSPGYLPSSQENAGSMIPPPLHLGRRSIRRPVQDVRTPRYSVVSMESSARLLPSSSPSLSPSFSSSFSPAHSPLPLPLWSAPPSISEPIAPYSSTVSAHFQPSNAVDSSVVRTSPSYQRHNARDAQRPWSWHPQRRRTHRSYAASYTASYSASAALAGRPLSDAKTHSSIRERPERRRHGPFGWLKEAFSLNDEEKETFRRLRQARDYDTDEWERRRRPKYMKGNRIDNSTRGLRERGSTKDGSMGDGSKHERWKQA